MRNIFMRFKVELLILVIVFLFVLGFVIAIILNQESQTQPQSTTLPGPIPPLLIPGKIDEASFSSYFKTEIGKTTEQELKAKPELREQLSKKSGLSEFTYNSAFNDRDNAIITENSVAAFKRVVTVNPETWETPQISAYEKAYGSPQAQYTGSAAYGRFIKTSVYADKGTAFVFNPTTGEVYEIQSFSPTTIENYLSKWGEDIKDYTTEIIEGP